MSGPLKQWKQSSTIKKAASAVAFCCLVTGVSYSQTNQWMGSNSNNFQFQGFNNQTLQLNMGNTSFFQFNTSLPYFLFAKPVRINSGVLGSQGTADLSLQTNGTERVLIQESDGFVGINLNAPTHHLQIHGTTDYLVNAGDPITTDPSFMQGAGNKPISSSTTTKSTTNLGSTGRLSITNSITGSGASDGALFMQTQNDLYISNQATGNFYLKGGGVNLSFENDRSYFGAIINASNSSLASVNIIKGGDNGLRVSATSPGKYGILSIASQGESALLVSTEGDPTASDINFKVTGDGEVYGRRFTTTLNAFPDYVFADDYNLMSYASLRTYINTNRHLPNMPTAEEVEQNGADLGELNRLLVEKVEELTLYILELEERLVEMEAQNGTETAKAELLSRIATLESLVKKLIEE